MSFEPTLFDSTMYETANDTVLFCKDFLEQRGYARLASQLASFTPVNGDGAALVLRDVLRNALPSLAGEERTYVALALNTVERALSERWPALSSCA